MPPLLSPPSPLHFPLPSPYHDPPLCPPSPLSPRPVGPLLPRRPRLCQTRPIMVRLSTESSSTPPPAISSSGTVCDQLLHVQTSTPSFLPCEDTTTPAACPSGSSTFCVTCAPYFSPDV